MAIFKGAGVAIVTPFHEDGSINYDKFEQLVNEQIEGGTDAIIVCGTTGEASTLTHEEHLDLIRFCGEGKRQGAGDCRNRVELYEDGGLSVNGGGEVRCGRPASRHTLL